MRCFITGSLFFALISCAACSKKQSDFNESADETYLQNFAHELKEANHNYNSLKRAKYFKEQIRLNPTIRHDHLFSMAKEYLKAGESKRAIQLFDSLEQIIHSDAVLYSDNSRENLLQEIKRQKALGYLRLGEQENCIMNHGHGSCIIPIAPHAVHQIKEGSSKAIELYKALLSENTDDHESKYLLNLAFMTLGTYPEQVPAEHLITSSLFKDEGQDMVKDVAMQHSLDVNGLAGGVIAEDFNQDGFIDLMVSSWDMQTHVQLFLNLNGQGWKDVSAEAGLSNIKGNINMMQTDFNNDGLPDVLILRGGWLGPYGHLPNTLLEHVGISPEGIPSFKDVTKTANIYSTYPTQTASWADFNNDGWLDVYIGNESAVTGKFNPSELYLNQKEGTFKEVGKQAGLSLEEFQSNAQLIVKSVSTADYNRDGWIDLFVSSRDGRNILFKNKGLNKGGIPAFEDVTKAAGIAEFAKTFTCWFWDYNNDGWEDLLVSGFHTDAFYEGKSISEDFALEQQGQTHLAATGTLYENQKNGSFKDVSEKVGLNKILYMMGGNFGDINSDGWLDFYVGNGDPDLRAVIPNRMFTYNGEKFNEVTQHGFGHIQKGHGAAFADFDHDGDQDIYMVMGGFYEGDVYQNILLENQMPVRNNYVEITLRGNQSNSFGVGSQLKIVLKEGKNLRSIYRKVNSGGSFGASSFKQHLGLGTATTIDTLQITWAGSGNTQTLTELSVNQEYIIFEKDGTAISSN